jgi:hypothetical protein
MRSRHETDVRAPNAVPYTLPLLRNSPGRFLWDN